MKTIRISPTLIGLITTFAFASCGKSNENSIPDWSQTEAQTKQREEAFTTSSESGATVADSVAIAYNAVGNANNATTSEGFISSSAARLNPDSSKLFIRRADLRYEVKDVRNSTLQTEEVVGQLGGWVEHTMLRSEITETTLTPVSEDSSLEEKHYKVVNDMTLRVPQNKLDTTLKALSRMIVFLDHRNISAEDVGLKMKFEARRQKRNEQYNKRLGEMVDQKGNKLGSIVDAEAERQSALERADQALMNQLETEDQIAFSSIQLQIYQRESVRRTLIPNFKNIDAYRPGFLKRLGNGLARGWDEFLGLVVALITIWPIWVSGAAIAAIWIWIRRRRKNGA